MSLSTRRARGAPATRLATRLYLYTFLDDLVLLYPVYALLFAETGLSTWQISVLFVIWSVASMALEIPSGVLADLVSRRSLLVVGPLLTGAGYTLWVTVPSFPSFAAGFVLWGAHYALRSGALEALVYEELARHGMSARYAQVIGRSRAAATVAVATAITLAVPVLAIGGYAAAGGASVLTCLATAVAAATLPEHRAARPHDARGGWRDSVTMLRSGVGEIRSTKRVLPAALLLVAISAVWGGLDEYLPLLAASTGVATETVPVLILTVYLGVAAGGLLGGHGRRLSRNALAVVLASAAVALAAGALAGHPAGFVLLGVAFCAFQATEIVADARLQEAIRGPARSTVTSVAGLGSEVATIGVYAAYGAASGAMGHGAIFASFAVVYALLALALAGRRHRERRSARPLYGPKIA